MDRKTEIEIVIGAVLAERQNVYRFRHDAKKALLQGGQPEWLYTIYLDTSKKLDELNKSLKALREEMKGL